MRIHHLNCGTLRPPAGRLVDGKPGLFRRGEMVCHCLLIETDTELVLVETGLGSLATTRPVEWLGSLFVRGLRLPLSQEETALHQVRQLGYDPADVRHIVLTHLDLDHAGGLADFPDATVHVAERELDAMRNPRNRLERTRYRKAQFAHGPKFSSYTAHGEPWFGFDAVRDLVGLPPEILLVPLAGHTSGHSGVAVDTGEGWLLNAGDTYFFHGQVDPVNPRTTPGLGLFERVMQTEAESRRHNLDRVRQLVRNHGDEVTVFCAHDAVELTRSLG
ncbi:MBL fold metallo-hydrolase [Saccharomonospora sp. NPDC046836]|uniref:MBL fold metallo-hydrolase n=1 Tax=Saccharomonospora sp. NPDC046836 TaxID=3156921 RepID=UPI0033ECD66F